MAILWVLEKSQTNCISLTSMLIGDYAIRAIASIENLTTLARISGHKLPDALVVDCRTSCWPLRQVAELVWSSMPGSLVVGVGRTSIPECALPRQVQVLEMPSNSMELSVNLTRYLEKAARRQAGSMIRYKDLVLECATQRLWSGDREMELSLPNKELQLLRLLLSQRGQVVPRMQIQEQIWPQVKVSPRTIDSHVSRIRGKLEGTKVTIKSVYGGGYMLR